MVSTLPLSSRPSNQVKYPQLPEHEDLQAPNPSQLGCACKYQEIWHWERLRRTESLKLSFVQGSPVPTGNKGPGMGELPL